MDGAAFLGVDVGDATTVVRALDGVDGPALGGWERSEAGDFDFLFLLGILLGRGGGGRDE